MKNAILPILIICSVFAIVGCDIETPEDQTATANAKAATEFANALLTATVVTWTPTPTATDTPTATATFTPSNTFTPTDTATATNTPTDTYTPSATFTPSNTYTPSATFTPSDTPRPTRTPRPSNTATLSASDLTIIRNVDLRGGISVYPEPSTSSGRIFAAVSEFHPHVAGKNEDGTWVYILYFQGSLQAGWASRNNVVLTDNQLRSLEVIDPDNPPPLPNLPYDEAAARPFGVAAPPVQPTQALPPVQPGQPTPLPTATLEPGQPTPVPQPTQPPQPTAIARPGNCSTAVAMGLSPQQAAQWSHLDRDNDGVACYGD